MDKLFSNKRTYIGSDGDEYLNLSIPVVNINKMSANSKVRADEDDNGRIDNFVWRTVEEDMNMIDLTMYANHIFNPFSIKSGDVLIVPLDSNDVYESSEEPKLPDGSTVGSSSGDNKKKTYAETVEYLAKKGFGLK